jgi:hypothetical protein
MCIVFATSEGPSAEKIADLFGLSADCLFKTPKYNLDHSFSITTCTDRMDIFCHTANHSSSQLECRDDYMTVIYICTNV